MRSGRNGKSYLQSGLKRVAEQIEIELSPHPNASAGKTKIPQRKQSRIRKMVPRAGIEPALLSEPDFESGASTNSANGASKVVAGI
jgi:hypothetical protein